MQIAQTQTIISTFAALTMLVGCGADDGLSDQQAPDEQANILVSECTPNPCGSRGACTDTLLGFQCTCTGGFTGARCDVAPGQTPPAPGTSAISGSATRAQCTSYRGTSYPFCGGYFCGVTEEQIAAALPAQTPCGSSAATLACDNTLQSTVARCAREARSSDVLASTPELRPLIESCALKNGALSATPAACLSCYVRASECDADHCLLECLTGDSRNCEACRAKNSCNTAALTCAGLPNPF
jgi:hypothetical protein